jgi:glucose-1-phosphate cytidylyltransferase
MNTAEIPVVILAGGKGARFDHESQVLPKPMIVVAGKPILEHIIDSFRIQGSRHFVVATGYLGMRVLCHFDDHPDYTLETEGPDGVSYRHASDGSVVYCVDTGLDAHTGERLTRLPFIRKRRFFLTYGDGLCDVDIAELLEYHRYHYDRSVNRGDLPPAMTVTAVHPPGRFGLLRFEDMAWHEEDNNMICEIQEKLPSGDWINGGFMVVEPEFFSLLHPEPGQRVPMLEAEAMVTCAANHRLLGYRHYGYWRCMDTRRDLEQIEADVLGHGGTLPWIRRGKVST